MIRGTDKYSHFVIWMVAIAAVAVAILFCSLAVRFIPVLRETVTKEVR
jgi:hypothetical protein